MPQTLGMSKLGVNCADPSFRSAARGLPRRAELGRAQLGAVQSLRRNPEPPTRTGTSSSVFDALSVRLCPACEQSIVPQRAHHEDACYLYFQPVNDDKRQRRAQVEIRSLKSELSELG